MQFCANAGRDTGALDHAFASLSLEKMQGSTGGTAVRSGKQSTDAGPQQIPVRNEKDAAATKELGMLLMAMRKLREGIVASGRRDEFARRAYIFIIRAAILTSTFESYQPALLHLLYKIHPVCPLSTSEVREFVGYHILDLVCRLREYGEAFAVRNRWRFKDRMVEGVLNALVRDDWLGFWRLKVEVDGYQRAIMSWAENDLRSHALKCLGKSYFSVEKSYLERCVGRVWEELKAKDGVGWELEGDRVTIRRIKRR